MLDRRINSIFALINGATPRLIRFEYPPGNQNLFSPLFSPPSLLSSPLFYFTRSFPSEPKDLRIYPLRLRCSDVDARLVNVRVPSILRGPERRFYFPLKSRFRDFRGPLRTEGPPCKRLMALQPVRYRRNAAMHKPYSR